MAGTMRYFDRQGQPITIQEWGARLGDDAARVVAQTDIDGVMVSTVWLGLDHSRGGAVPIIFETMVFGGDLDGRGERYSTEADAKAGHDRIVAAVRAGR